MKCLFCGQMITPEESLIGLRSGYTFQCENRCCGAIYDSVGPKIPNIIVRYRPINHQELDFG